METRQERTGRAPITLEIRTLDTLIPTATPEARLPPPRIILATQPQPIETGTDTLKVLPLPQPIISETAALNSAATTPIPPSGHGSNIPLHTMNPESGQAPTFGGHPCSES